MDTNVRIAVPTDSPSIARVRIDSWRTAYKGIIAEDYLADLSYVDGEARCPEQLIIPEPLCLSLRTLLKRRSLDLFQEVRTVHKIQVTQANFTRYTFSKNFAAKASGGSLQFVLCTETYLSQHRFNVGLGSREESISSIL